MTTPDNAPISKTQSTPLMERDRVGPLKEASLRAFDLLIEIQQQGGDAERMFFGVGLALMKLMEIGRAHV